MNISWRIVNEMREKYPNYLFGLEDKFTIEELADVVAGANLVMSNQNFVYSLAMGLGKSTVLETFGARTNLMLNECFFARPNCYYF